MKSFCTRLVALAALTLVAACNESPTPTGLSPDMAISDGAHSGGNANFFFLPPMVPNPSPAGTFDGSLQPEVQVCVWNGSDCVATLAIFNTDAGYGSETVRVSTTDEHYIVNWHTEEILDNYTLGAGETFRVRILAQGQELGFADIAVVGSAKELKNVDTDEFIGLMDGRTLPIKFRIEEGALTAAGEIASAGAHHSCVVASNGDGYCWGWNDNGRLGTGTAGGSFNTPQLVAGGHTWQSIQAGDQSTCGLTTAGQMYCWGSNSQGQLGIGVNDFVPHPTPEPVIGGHTFASLPSLGSNHFSACGVTTTGDMYCWGSNSLGELGRGFISNIEPTPGLVIGGHTFAGSAAMERRKTCGVTTGGDILCWGLNDFGALGRGFASGIQPTPGLVIGGHTFESVTTGAAHACGIDAAGAALCWGRNISAELGIGSTGGNFPTPQFVSGGHAFTQLSGGWTWGCGVRTDGAGLCWGSNSFGELGRGFTGLADGTPGLITGGHTFEAIGAGLWHACGVTATGDTFCWGRNFYGQLGNGSFTDSPIPVFALDITP